MKGVKIKSNWVDKAGGEIPFGGGDSDLIIESFKLNFLNEGRGKGHHGHHSDIIICISRPKLTVYVCIAKTLGTV